jgi:TRAP-type C4-dicarboxylate transport system substrate-binding protein
LAIINRKGGYAMRGHGKQARWLTVLASVVLSVVLISGFGVAAERKVIKLRLAAGHPYAAAAWVKTLEDFFAPELEKRVLAETDDSKVVCQGFYGGSLAKLGEVLEAVENGIVDIGIVNNVFELAKLEIFTFNWWIPFTSPDMRQVILANIKVLDQFPVFEETLARYNQRRVGNAFNQVESFNLITNFPVKTMEDLKGRKIAHGGPMIPWLKALGAVGVQSVFTDAYTSIDTGVYEGWAMPLNVALTFKVYEVAPYYTIVDFGASVPGYVTINLDTWKRLSPEVERIMIEVGDAYSWKLYERQQMEKNQALETMTKAGCTIHTLAASERARWAEVLAEAGVAKTAATRAEAHGYPATEILKAYVKALEAEGYTFPHPPKL